MAISFRSTRYAQKAPTCVKQVGAELVDKRIFNNDNVGAAISRPAVQCYHFARMQANS